MGTDRVVTLALSRSISPPPVLFSSFCTKTGACPISSRFDNVLLVGLLQNQNEITDTSTRNSASRELVYSEQLPGGLELLRNLTFRKSWCSQSLSQNP